MVGWSLIVALPSLRVDLPRDELETIARIGDLFVQRGGELGKQIAMFAGSRFGIEMQLCDLAGEEGVALGREVGDVALGVLDLAGDA
jgi:hypothetical protein